VHRAETLSSVPVADATVRALIPYTGRAGRRERGEVSTSRDEQFRTYVLASRGRLVRTATFLASGDRFAAEDLVQTALMRLYVAWPRVRAETIDAYARKALLNALIDDRRRAFTRHERAHAQLPEIAVIDPPATDTEAAVFRALAELPPRMRAAVVLRHLCELSVTETAAALNCSEGTVKSQTARGLTQLRTSLTPEILHPSGLPTDTVMSVDRRHAVDTIHSAYRGSDD
jgi:RNA polymerase sigma-70 factor (sigma-E family)